jgi:hypothetical protein
MIHYDNTNQGFTIFIRAVGIRVGSSSRKISLIICLVFFPGCSRKGNLSSLNTTTTALEASPLVRRYFNSHLIKRSCQVLYFKSFFVFRIVTGSLFVLFWRLRWEGQSVFGSSDGAPHVLPHHDDGSRQKRQRSPI